MDRSLIKPILLLLRAHAVHPSRLQIVLGDFVDELVGQTGRPAEIVGAGRGGARVGARLPRLAVIVAKLVLFIQIHIALDIAAADGHRRAGEVGDAAAQRAERRVVVLVLQVGVAVADDAAARVAAVKLLVDALELR